jgi:hypothetical protein
MGLAIVSIRTVKLCIGLALIGAAMLGAPALAAAAENYEPGTAVHFCVNKYSGAVRVINPDPNVADCGRSELRVHLPMNATLKVGGAGGVHTPIVPDGQWHTFLVAECRNDQYLTFALGTLTFYDSSNSVLRKIGVPLFNGRREDFANAEGGSPQPGSTSFVGATFKVEPGDLAPGTTRVVLESWGQCNERFYSGPGPRLSNGQPNPWFHTGP